MCMCACVLVGQCLHGSGCMAVIVGRAWDLHISVLPHIAASPTSTSTIHKAHAGMREVLVMGAGRVPGCCCWCWGCCVAATAVGASAAAATAAAAAAAQAAREGHSGLGGVHVVFAWECSHDSARILPHSSQ